MTDNEVHLTVSEMFQAAMVGVWRQIDCLNKPGEAHNDQPFEQQWQDQVEGSMGERAFAKWMGIYYAGTVGGTKAHRRLDVGGFEVKTRSQHTYGIKGTRDREPTSMLVKERDDNRDQPFVLLTGIMGKYRVCGWVIPEPFCTGEPQVIDAKRGQDNRGWFISQTELHGFHRVPGTDRRERDAVEGE